MIEEISIRDLGVIAEAKLKFGPGLTVLTGETGAGKTMVLTAVGLLLGERSDTSAIRQGQDQAFVEGRWQINQHQKANELVVEAGGNVDAGELIVNRSVARDGRSRSAIGGAAAPVNLLASLGEQLVAVHGQSDQIRLKSGIAQREALDQFSGVATLLSKYRDVFDRWKTLEARLETLRSASSSRETEIQQLQEATAELDRLKPEAGEDEALAEKAQRLTHSEELRIAASEAHELLSSENTDTDAIALVGKARRVLEAASVNDPELGKIAETLRQLGFQLGENAAALNGYLASSEGGGAAELEQVQQRRADLGAAMRKYGPTLAEVIAFQETAGKKLLELDNSDEQIAALTLERDGLFAEVQDLAGQVTAVRKHAALRLETAVTEELKSLAMGGATLVVSVTETSEYQLHGADLVSIQLAAYPGAEPRPIGKGASGGELSRIMLAIEVVLAKTEQALTFIFDEVDAGVGGAAAIEVGKRLAQLAKVAQVIVVTHLGQVAAFANQHLRVLKTMSDQYTASDVVELQGEDRVEEIARMLSGMAESDTARANARELMIKAKEFVNQ
ncbi:MAG: DNA repair protein RecN [Actinobacteria bacterium]|uniref:DNA repair protein RecN n=1 Tax=freshwater metagenome TaxID=449393 RepID=A0A6J6I2B3_9ZZZZ|nr:DNA repair protein RecN [Actinomycetota bacterium]